MNRSAIHLANALRKPQRSAWNSNYLGLGFAAILGRGHLRIHGELLDLCVSFSLFFFSFQLILEFFYLTKRERTRERERERERVGAVANHRSEKNFHEAPFRLIYRNKTAFRVFLKFTSRALSFSFSFFFTCVGRIFDEFHDKYRTS